MCPWGLLIFQTGWKWNVISNFNARNCSNWHKGGGALGISEKDKRANIEDSIFNGSSKSQWQEKKSNFTIWKFLFFFPHRFKYLTKAWQHRPIQICWQVLKPLSRLDPTHPRLIYKHILKFCYIFVHDTFAYVHTLAHVNALSLLLSRLHKHTHTKTHSLLHKHAAAGVSRFSHIQTKSHYQYAYVAIYITAEIVISSLVRPLTFSLNTPSLSVSVRAVWTYVQLRNQSIRQYRYVWMQTSAVCMLHKVWMRTRWKTLCESIKRTDM